MKSDSEMATGDPLIDEIRAIRKSISDRFGNDVDRLIEHLRQIEKQHPDRVVRPQDPEISQTSQRGDEAHH